MATADLVLTREQVLLTVVDRFISTHNAWVASPDKLITDRYEAAVLEMMQEFASGDLPSKCRMLAAAVAELAEEWTRYEGYVTQRNPMPRDHFWVAVQSVIKQRTGNVIRNRPPIETIAELDRQNLSNTTKISDRQIAEMYSENGEGPFMVNGQPRAELVQQEREQPGSVLPKDFVHPAEYARQKREAALAEVRLQRLAAKFPRNPVAPEPMEDLLRQGVPAPQIAEMKQVDIAEVYAEAQRLGIEAKERESVFNMRDPLDKALSASDEAALNPTNPTHPNAMPAVEQTQSASMGGIDLDELDDAEESVEYAAGADAVMSVEDEIVAYHAEGLPAREIATALDITVSKVNRVIHKRGAVKSDGGPPKAA